ncbi:MAG TPA: hypothetical protein VGB51_07125 [Actinomycetota bacterium]
MTPASKGRRTAFLVLTLLGGLGLGLGAFAFPSLVLGWFGIGDREIHRVHDLAWGAHAGLLIALPLLLQSRAPERKPAAMQQAVLAMVALALGYAISSSLEVFILIPIVVLALLWWLHPARGRLLARGDRARPVMFALVLLSAIPLTMYAFDQAEVQRACPAIGSGTPIDELPPFLEHCDEFHFAGMATLSFGIVLVGALGSLGTGGWRIPARTAATAAMVLGLASIVFPNATSSIGTRWGAIALAGGLVYLTLAELPGRGARAG